MTIGLGLGLSFSRSRSESSIIIAPVASGAIPDQSFTEDVEITPLDVSTDFTGTRLTFALAPSSADLPAGLSLSSAGVISGTPTTVAAEADIVVRATNSAGTADTAFGVTIAEASVGTTILTRAGDTVIDRAGNEITLREAA